MFLKYEVYTTAQSLYCYPNTNVLKNKLNIHDQEVLKRAEEAITAVKQLDFRHSWRRVEIFLSVKTVE